MKLTSKQRVLFLALLTNLSPVFAHSGAGVEGLLAGIQHPFMGIDHLFVMLGVGVWAAMQQGRLRYLCPLAFLSAMAIGAVFAMQGGVLPLAEVWVACSVVVMGFLVGRSISRAPGPLVSVARLRSSGTVQPARRWTNRSRRIRRVSPLLTK